MRKPSYRGWFWISTFEPLNLSCGDAGFTCAYRNTLAWKSATLPLPMENNPQIVFERLFGDGSTDAQRQERRAQARSLLDSVRDQVPALEKDLPPGDRRRLREYLEEVREIERRVQQFDATLSRSLDLPDAPTGIPADFESHLKLLFDLQVLAYKSEITRISTLMLARENSNTVYPATRRAGSAPRTRRCLHLPDLVFHEAGHILCSAVGRFMTLGVSLALRAASKPPLVIPRSSQELLRCRARDRPA